MMVLLNKDIHHNNQVILLNSRVIHLNNRAIRLKLLTHHNRAMHPSQDTSNNINQLVGMLLPLSNNKATLMLLLWVVVDLPFIRQLLSSQQGLK